MLSNIMVYLKPKSKSFICVGCFNNMLAKKGMGGSTIMGVIFGTILIVAVAIPVTTSVITTANLSGTTATVVGFIPLFLGLAGLALAAALISR